jgi:hypothetical protein
MAEQTMAEQATKLTLSDIPERKVLEDGNQLLAEANAYLVRYKHFTVGIHACMHASVTVSESVYAVAHADTRTLVYQ